MFDLSTPAAFLSVLVFLPAVVALFIAIAPLSGEQAKWISLAATAVMFVMSMAMIFGWSQVQFAAGDGRHAKPVRQSTGSRRSASAT